MEKRLPARDANAVRKSFALLQKGEEVFLGKTLVRRVVFDERRVVAKGTAEITAAREYGAGYVVMHNPCGADTVQDYPDGVISHIRSIFLETLKLAAECGLQKEQLCFDVGLGFSKTYEDNLEILRNLEWLKFKGVPLLVAASRKRFIGIATGEENSAMRDPGTVAAHTVAVAAGADIIRAHDVAGAVQGARLADAIFRKTGE